MFLYELNSLNCSQNVFNTSSSRNGSSEIFSRILFLGNVTNMVVGNISLEQCFERELYIKTRRAGRYIYIAVSATLLLLYKRYKSR